MSQAPAFGEYVLFSPPAFATQWCIQFEEFQTNQILGGPVCGNIDALLTMQIPPGAAGHFRIGVFEVSEGTVLQEAFMRFPSEDQPEARREVVIEGDHTIQFEFGAMDGNGGNGNGANGGIGGIFGNTTLLIGLALVAVIAFQQRSRR